MAAADEPDIATEFGARLVQAIKAAGTTQSAVARALNLPGARMPRLLGKGKNPIRSPGPDVIRELADHLGVSYEWLAIGRGDPGAGGGKSGSALEEAMVFARKHHVRADAIDAAVAALRDEASTLNGIDWILAFNAHAQRLDRLAVPRPEVVEKAQKQLSRLSTKRARLMKELADLDQHEQAVRPQAERRPKKSTRP